MQPGLLEVFKSTLEILECIQIMNLEMITRTLHYHAAARITGYFHRHSLKVVGSKLYTTFICVPSLTN